MSYDATTRTFSIESNDVGLASGSHNIEVWAHLILYPTNKSPTNTADVTITYIDPCSQYNLELNSGIDSLFPD